MIINNNLINYLQITMDQDIRFDRWVKKLYNLRQKALADMSSFT